MDILTDILKDSDYALDLFDPSEIQALEERVVFREMGGVQKPAVEQIDDSSFRVLEFRNTGQSEGEIVRECDNGNVFEILGGDFNNNKSFPFVILPNNQFRELLTRKEQLSCLRCIREHLENKGSLVIDIANPFNIISRSTAGEVFHRKVGYCQETESVVECLFTITARNLIEQWVESETTYIEHFSNGKTVRHTGRSRLRYIFPAELELLLEISGFKIVEKWGGYDFDKLEENSPRLIIQAIKEDS